MNEKEYTYDPKGQTMVFSTGTRCHIRVAYSDEKVWYVICDIAKLLRYRAPSKVIDNMDCEVRLLRVPHTSENVRGFTNCNCISQDAVKRFIKTQRSTPELCEWILNVVIPQAERQFSQVKTPGEKLTEPTPNTTQPVTIPQMASMLDALDQFIIAAVSLRREIQFK